MRVTRLATAALVLGVAFGHPAHAVPEVSPRVIGGIPNPPLATAAVAFETSTFACTASLWRPRLLATAAHCLYDDEGNRVDPEDITLWSPGASTTTSPSSVRVTSIIMDESWDDTEDDDEATGRDFALLVLDAPLGTPAWSRMATPDEVAALTWNGADASYVGYGVTSPRVDPNGVLSTAPEGYNASFTWGYDGGIGAFTLPGDGVRGTCGGDSGGPWMSKVGTQLLYIGPLSGGSGLPCDKPESPEETFDTGAVASANIDITRVGLSAIGEGPDVVPTTCIRGEDVEEQCWEGLAWEYEYCWGAKKAQLWKVINGKRARVGTYTGYKDDACTKKNPYLVIFRRIELSPSAKYEVVLPKQRGLSRAARDPFTATVR